MARMRTGCRNSTKHRKTSRNKYIHRVLRKLTSLLSLVFDDKNDVLQHSILQQSFPQYSIDRYMDITDCVAAMLSHALIDGHADRSI